MAKPNVRREYVPTIEEDFLPSPSGHDQSDIDVPVDAPVSESIFEPVPGVFAEPEVEARQGVGLEEPMLPNGWRPIDTAPKDGTQIEVATDVNGHPITAYWRETRQMAQFRWKKTGRWTSPLNNSNIDVFPTVWRFLPTDKWGDAVAAAKRAESGNGEAA